MCSRGLCINARRLAQSKPQQCCLSWDVNETSCCDLVGYKRSEAISIQLDGCSLSNIQGFSLLLQKQHLLWLLDVIFWLVSRHVAAHWTRILVVWRKNPMCDPSARDAAKPDDSCSGPTWRKQCTTAAQASWPGFALLHLCMIEGYGSCYVNLLHSAIFKSLCFPARVVTRAGWRMIRDTDQAAKSDVFQSPQDGFSLNWCCFKGFFLEILFKLYCNAHGTKGNELLLLQRLYFLDPKWSCIWYNLCYKLKWILISFLMNHFPKPHLTGKDQADTKRLAGFSFAPQIQSQFIILFDGGHFEVIWGVVGGVELQHHLNPVQICGEINGKSTCRQLEMKELTNKEMYTVVREEYQPDFIPIYCRKWVEIKLQSKS